MPIKWNKWEWSEFYAFLKILVDRKLFAADEKLNIIPKKFYIFHKIIREELSWNKIIYDIENTPENEIKITKNDKTIIFFDAELPQKTKKIFDSIKNASTASFSIEEATLIMDKLLCTRIKASSWKKADLVGIIDDRISLSLAELWFSIKSSVWSPSSLLNAGDTTNFIFNITWFNWSIEKINSIMGRSKIRDRVKSIKEMWGEFNFVKVKNKIFQSNLRKIDTVFPKILSQMILDFYSWKWSNVFDLTSNLESSDALSELWLTKSDYEFKIKTFLDAIALGMVPWTEWNWISEAKGWYIIVREDGEVICYHLYNRDELRWYLFDNTKFETPSSKKHWFWVLYEESWKLYFNLNLQIRF